MSEEIRPATTAADASAIAFTPDGSIAATDVQAAIVEVRDEAGAGYTDEQAQDAVGAMVGDTATVDLTYTDATPLLKADVIPGGIKLDDLGAPDDNTDLNASTGQHGLLPKLGGGSTNYLRADGTWAAPSGAGAPASVDYLVGTADAGLSGEIVVGTTPGGELGGTWAAPTVDALHGGSRHHIPTLLSSVKGSADTPDDEFSAASGAALDAKWTVVDGTNGAVTLNAAAGAGLYRQGQRAGWLMMQLGTAVGDSVVLRQDYTLPDGACIVVPVSCALDMAAAVANSEVAFGIGVNNNDTSVDAAGATLTAQVLFDADAGGARIIGWDSAAVVGQSFATQQVAVNDLFFVRIDRVGLVYHLFWSRDGYSWNYLGGKTLASAANNVWLFAECRATMANRIVVGCPWFRQGTALAVDPWPL